jgi:hypothetical protein
VPRISKNFLKVLINELLGILKIKDYKNEDYLKGGVLLDEDEQQINLKQQAIDEKII